MENMHTDGGMQKAKGTQNRMRFMEKWMNYDIWYMKVSVVGHARIIGLLTLLDAKIMMMIVQTLFKNNSISVKAIW